MDTVEKEEVLPLIEHNINWKRKPDLPAWRQASPEVREVRLKSVGEKA